MSKSNSVSKNLNYSDVNALYTKVENLIINLADIWLDEYMYEDIKKYGKVIEKKMIEINPEFEGNIKMTKRPFGFKFKVSHYTFRDGRVAFGEIHFTDRGWQTTNMKFAQIA